jgi:hypothetical protein
MPEQNGQARMPPLPAGDFGLGLCLPCCADLIAGERTVTPAFAIVHTPVAAGAMIAVCGQHLLNFAGRGPGRRLFVPGP